MSSLAAGAAHVPVAALLSRGTLDHLLGTYGYAAVLAFVLVESLGVPLPGESMLIAAALYAGATHRLAVGLVVAAAAAGAILGDNAGYGLGRWGGYRLLRRYGHLIRVDERKLKVGRYLFLRRGGTVVFLGRFVSILRTYAAFLAGTNFMPWWRFAASNAAGGILWAALYGFGFYFVGRALEQLSTPVDIGLGAAAAAVAIALVVYLKRNERRLEARAERALPGPLDGPGPAGPPRAPRPAG